jgi:dCMP deaminase
VRRLATVGSKKEVLSQGFNGFPRNINDTDERYNNRATKYKFVVHAEMNAIYKLKSPSKNAR